jgi:hypothetical protein
LVAVAEAAVAVAVRADVLEVTDASSRAGGVEVEARVLLAAAAAWRASRASRIFCTAAVDAEIVVRAGAVEEVVFATAGLVRVAVAVVGAAVPVRALGAGVVDDARGRTLAVRGDPGPVEDDEAVLGRGGCTVGPVLAVRAADAAVGAVNGLRLASETRGTGGLVVLRVAVALGDAEPSAHTISDGREEGPGQH